MFVKQGDFLFHVVLVEPEIPQNTGNVGRTCVGTCSRLHLVEPLGFDLSDSGASQTGWTRLLVPFGVVSVQGLEHLVGTCG